MDLLTAVMHEMGHLLGLEHSDDPYDLMFETLDAGRRRNPEWERLAVALSADSTSGTRLTLWDDFYSDPAELDEALSLI